MRVIGKVIGNEATGGALLLIATIFALIAENSSLQHLYHEFLHISFSLDVGAHGQNLLAMDMHGMVNDLLMAIFFMLVGIEIKREILHGHLNSLPAVLMPGIAAAAGMAIPAMIYVSFNLNNPDALKGWAIPSATDIAFAVGVLALLGKRVPYQLKLFLLTVAVLDDMGAIVVIAVFYSNELNLAMLGLSGITLLILCLFNWLGVYRRSPYLVAGALMWYFVLQSGVHATIAGVMLALSIPTVVDINSRKFNAMGIVLNKYYGSNSPALRMENSLAGWVTFFILPLFAFTNAGVPLGGVGFDTLSGVTYGVALGLTLGKAIGIFGACLIMFRIGFATIPTGVRQSDYLGIALLCGIGFTMSLFITDLSFNDIDITNQARIGILSGSSIAAILGYVYLRATLKRGRRSKVVHSTV